MRSPTAPATTALAAAANSPTWVGPRLATADYEIGAESAGGCIFARVGGSLAIDKFLSALHILGIETDGRAEQVMLLDLRDLQTVYERTELLRVGEEIACSFAHIERLALLTRPQRVTRISERSARRTGMNMAVFDMESNAMMWLRGAGD